MKTLLAASLTGLALLSGSALAADLPPAPQVYKAPPVMAPVYNWTGFYFGGGFGYGMWNQGTTPVGTFLGVPGTLAGSFNNGGMGWSGQIKVGADYQFNSNIVAGVFADYDPSNIKGNFATGGAVNFFSPINGQEKLTSSWAVGGRIGWLITPTVLSYFNGGYNSAHFGGINATSFGVNGGTPLAVPVSIAAHNYNGWFAGGGVEAPITFLPLNGLFFYTEYRYSYYTSTTLPVANGGIGGGFVLTGETIKPNVQTVVSGLDYRFNWTGH
jgi:outer membrane immunogenic protein